ncbi:acetolactate synthase [Heyndrickxia sporothermodurans]|nr:acetolactate synthase [Heyndrickxia sporothermodurans]
MKATDMLVQCLENEGVEYIFGIPGKETLDLVNSLSKSKQIQFVNVRHEQGAAFMADVYARLSNKAGVCLATLGPGATNLLTGIASAQLDHSPVIAITGQAPFERQHEESHQYINVVKMFEPVTKWATQIKESQSIPTIIRKAFKIAKTEKSGAVIIELPENLATQMISAKPISVNEIFPVIPILEGFQDAVSTINKSSKPFIIIGNGIIRQNAENELLTFAETLQAPVIHSFMSKGILPKTHQLNFYTFGFNKDDIVLSGIDEADLLIVIGFDFVEKLPKEWNKKKIAILHIDSNQAETNEYYPVGVELVGNLKNILNEINQLKPTPKPWKPFGNLQETIRRVYQIDEKPTDIQSLPLTIENVLSIIETFSPAKTIVVSDVGAHKTSIARTYQPMLPNRLILSNGLASMGIALPGSIGAKLACPNDPVICITGDGGALMNIAELETAKRLGLSFIIIVLNDSVLKMEQDMMDEKFGTNFGVSFNNPDYIQLAESFRVIGKRANTLTEFSNIFSEALTESKKITIIDIHLHNSLHG